MMNINVLNKKAFCLDPRTKLILMAVVSTAEFLYRHTSFMVAVALIPFVLLMLNKQFKTGFGFFVLFGLALLVKENQSYLHINIALNMMVVLLEGLVLRLFPAFAMGSYVINSTKASEFISAMGHIHVTRKITIPLSVLFRFLPTMREESASIKDAMRMREIQFGTKRFWKNPLGLVEYRFIPLMISTIKIGNELSAAALTRGLDNPIRRTNITRVGFTAWDIIALFISAAALYISLLF